MPKLPHLPGNSQSRENLKRLSGRIRRGAQHTPSQETQPIFLSQPASPLEGRSLLPSFVALDVETTGLDAKRDRIIEIGAVRFSGSKPTDRFYTYVNPQRPIPPAITELTGITDSDVAEAPAFGEIIESLLSFLGSTPLCGHHVAFDIDFLNEELKRVGMGKIENPLLDSAVLARIVLPKLAGYSLTNVSRTISYDLRSAHRALDDALASGCVAVELLSRLGEIAPSIRRRMVSFAPPSLLKTLLQRSLNGTPLIENETSIIFSPPRKLSRPEKCLPIEIGEVEAFFAPDGKLARVMRGFAPRDAQTRMAREVTTALNTGSFFIAEAATGTGKSLAYLVPAALYALRNNWRVLVSTRTRNLQHQLMSKDIPLVAEAVGNGLLYALLKGRSNYLCSYRFERLLAGALGNLSWHERMGVLPLIRWAKDTQSGDIEEQSQFSRASFQKVWNLISADSHHCLGRSCPSFDGCFLQRARQRAAGAHIVVINHSLFFSDVCAQSSFLSEPAPIIFDEAHHLESIGYQHLRVDVDTNRINNYLESMTNLQKQLEKSAASAGLGKIARRLKPLIKRLRKDSANLLQQLDAWATDRQPSLGQYQFALRNYPFKALCGVGAFDYELKEAQDFLSDLRFCLVEQENSDELIAEVAACTDQSSQLKADLAYVTAAITDDHVFWIEGDHEKGWVKLSGVPLDIGEILSRVWDANYNGMVFTSATLAVGGSMEYFMPKIGLSGKLASRVFMQAYASPFDAHQTYAASIVTAPDPDQPEYAAFVAQTLASFVKELGRNMLVLFTANAMLREVYSQLLSLHAIEKTKLLAQGITGNRHVIFEQFRALRGAVLLGTDSFWEGVDAPGEACEVVVIARLPFPLPTHPLTQAIAHRYEKREGESFYSFSLPEAMIRFRQGIGRLIRGYSDRGLLLILDNRIVKRSYGKAFVDSLPAHLHLHSSIEEAVTESRRFFEEEKSGTHNNHTSPG